MCQAYDHIVDTCNWNYLRGNTPITLDLDLEMAMLQEELDEFKLAVANDDKVAMFDALLDLDFVRIGTLYKLNVSPAQQMAGYSAVLAANNTKSSSKNAEGKITKPSDFVGPEAKLEEILNG